jgi:hypothetical protein
VVAKVRAPVINTFRKPTFYRNRLSNFIVWVIFAWGVLYLLIHLIHDVKETEPSSFLIVLDAILMIGFLIPAVRIPRHGVVTTSTKVIIRNIVRTYVVHWEDVERFELAPYDRLAGVRAGTAVLKDGRRIRMTGVQTVAFEWAYATKFAKKTVAALNEQLAEARHSPR